MLNMNPDQQMVDNATSALAAKNANLGGRRAPSPVAKPKGNGRMEAISRRLAKGRK